MNRLKTSLLISLLFATVNASAEAARNAEMTNTQKLSELTERAFNSDISSFHFLGSKCSLLFIGTQHTFDSNSPTIAFLDQFLQAYSPTEIVVEGGTWPVHHDREVTISKYGEMAYVSRYAASNAITTSTFDPSDTELMAHALKVHSPEQVKLYFVLRMVPQIRATQSPQEFAAAMNRVLVKSGNDFNRASGNPSARPNSVLELNALTAQYFHPSADWRAITTGFEAQGFKSNEVLAVDRTVNGYRSAALAAAIAKKLIPGRKVFVVAGVTHLASVLPNLNPLEAICK